MYLRNSPQMKGSIQLTMPEKRFQWTQTTFPGVPLFTICPNLKLGGADVEVSKDFFKTIFLTQHLFYAFFYFFHSEHFHFFRQSTERLLLSSSQFAFHGRHGSLLRTPLIIVLINFYVWKFWNKNSFNSLKYRKRQILYQNFSDSLPIMA